MNAARNIELDLPELAAAVREGQRSAVASALNLLDDARPAERERARILMSRLPDFSKNGSSHLVGLTGPPGTGKSTLTSALIKVWRARALTVGILAVDPSSPLSGGALLGDRVRMMSGHADDGVFIRSLASRGAYGGLATEVWPMSLVMLAAFDIVLVETVGVGQREIDVSKMTDTTCYVAQPASGDSIQFLKAGIMEVPDVLVVNKEDIGAAARKTLSELRASVPRGGDDAGWAVPVLSTSATEGTGIKEVADALEEHKKWLARSESLAGRRRRIQAEWIIKQLDEEFGRFGVNRLGGEEALLEVLSRDTGSVFDRYEELQARLLVQLGTQAKR